MLGVDAPSLYLSTWFACVTGCLYCSLRRPRALRWQAIMQGLRQVEDEVAQLSALSELNDLLSISSEDNVAAFPTESMVPLLVSLPHASRGAFFVAGSGIRAMRSKDDRFGCGTV